MSWEKLGTAASTGSLSVNIPATSASNPTVYLRKPVVEALGLSDGGRIDILVDRPRRIFAIVPGDERGLCATKSGFNFSIGPTQRRRLFGFDTDESIRIPLEEAVISGKKAVVGKLPEAP